MMLADRPCFVGSCVLAALYIAGSAQAGKAPGGDPRMDAIWQRKGSPIVTPAGVDVAALAAEVVGEDRALAGSRALLAGSFIFVDLFEMAIDELEVRFYLTGGEPLTIPIKKKVKGGPKDARMEMQLAWEGPILVLTRRMEKGASAVERISIASDGTLRVDLEWTGPPATEPLRAVQVFSRISGGPQ